MKNTYMTIQDFQKKFGTDRNCLEWLFRIRKRENNLCFNYPKCKGTIDKQYKLMKGRKCMQCGWCLGHFYPMVNSIFDHTHVDLQHWFEIIFKLLYSRNGVSALEIMRTYGYSYATSLRVLESIRDLMNMCLDAELFSGDSPIEVDESFISTGSKSLGRHYRFATGRGSEKHTSVLVIAERMGKAKLFVIDSTNAESIIPKITENVPHSALVYTDNWFAYNKLSSLGYEHTMVNHSIEFVRDAASTNVAEGIFAQLKWALATHRNVSEKKLPAYLNEQAFRHTFRLEPDYGFETLMKCLSSLDSYYGNKEEKIAA